MKYQVNRGCAWNGWDCYGREGQTVAASELKTPDGDPLPLPVLDHFVRSGNLSPVTPKAADEATPKKKADK